MNKENVTNTLNELAEEAVAEKAIRRSSDCGSTETNPTSIHEDSGSIPGLTQWIGFAMSSGVGHRCGSDLALLWLWCRPAAVATIPPLAWELPYAAPAVLKKNKKTKKPFLHYISTHNRILKQPE